MEVKGASVPVISWAALTKLGASDSHWAQDRKSAEGFRRLGRDSQGSSASQGQPVPGSCGLDRPIGKTLGHAFSLHVDS